MKKIIKKILRKKPSRLSSFDDFIASEGYQNLFESLVKTSIALIFVVDKKGVIKLSEGKGLKSLGFKPGELVGRSVFEMYKGFPTVINGFKKSLKGKSNSYVTTLDGTSFLTNLSPLKNKDGKIIGTQGMSVEITKQIELEEKLKQSESSYRTIFNHSNDAIFIHDLKTGKIIDVNQKMLKMYGFSKKEALEGDIGLISSGVPPYDQKGAKAKVALAAAGEPQVFEWHGRNKAGKLFWVEVSLGIVTIEGEVRVIASVRDIAERKVLEEQLLHITKMKNEFLSITAHQLRTPLGAMRWNIELILSKQSEYKLDPEVKDFLDKTYKSNIRLINLVNNLLDVSRIDQNSVKVLIEKFDITKALASSIEQLEYEFKVKNLKIQLRVVKGHRYNVELDKRQYKDVVTNLIHNAIKYSDEKSKIHISVEKKPNFFVVKVKNTGIGIKEKEKQHIYEKFFRGTNAIKSGTSGSGLGLFIAKSFVEGWGGSMNFTSKENQVTTFTFTIPVNKSK